MGWLTDRSKTVAGAKQRFGFLFSIIAVVLGVLIRQYWPQIQTLFTESADGDTGLMSAPLWLWGLALVAIIFGVWMLEHANDLRKQLEPKLKASFEPEYGGFTEAVMRHPNTPDPVDNCKYVRLTVQSASEKSVESCVANLVKIERRVGLERTDSVWDADSLPLQWAITHELETRVHYLSKRFVDVARIRKSNNHFELLTSVPYRSAEMLNQPGKYIFTVIVTGDGISKAQKIEIEADGTYDNFKARAL